jgi:hypothetical protein
MRSTKFVGLLSLAVGIVIGSLAPSFVGGSATAANRYVVKCLAEQFNLTNPNVTIHNPSTQPVKIKQLALSSSGSEVDVGGSEFTLGPKQSLTINYAQNAISVLQYTTKSKILVDGYVFYEHPLNDEHQDRLRHMECFGV